MNRKVFVFIFVLGCWGGNIIFLCAQDNYEIKEFKLEGVKQGSETALREVLATKAAPWINKLLFWEKAPLFNSNDFQLDLQRIVRFYRARGFYRVRVSEHHIQADDEKRQVRLLVKITENRPTRVTTLKMAPSDTTYKLPDLDKQLAIKIGDPLDEARLRTSRLALQTEMANFGYPYAKVETEVMRDPQHETAEVTFKIEPGDLCAFGPVEILDTRIYPQRVIREELAFKTGHRFDQSKLLETQQRIYRLDLFRSVVVRAVGRQEAGNDIPVEIRVREAPRHALRVGLGYGTEDKLRTLVNFRRRNFLGDARRLQLEFKYSDLEPGSTNLTIFQPHFPDRKTLLQINTYLAYQKEKVQEDRSRETVYSLGRFGEEVIAQRLLGRYSNGSLRFRYEQINNDYQEEQFDYRKTTMSLGLLRNSGLPLFAPSRGTYSSMELDFSSLGAGGGGFQYLKLTLEARRYSELYTWMVLASRLRLGVVNALKDEFNASIPPEDRLYAGGSSSVRGWGRLLLGPRDDTNTPSGGNSLFEGSLESRLAVWKNFGAAAFVDFGNVWPRPSDFELLDLYYSAGWGLRYATPIGPVRLDFAWKLNQQPFDAGKFEFHLSIGQTF